MNQDKETTIEIRYCVEYARFEIDTEYVWCYHPASVFATEQEAQDDIKKITSSDYVFRIRKVVTIREIVEYRPE